jgi:hypothetical protein
MQFRYVPILRWKQGERIGLGHLSSLGRADVIPLVVALDSKYGSAAQFTQPHSPRAHPPATLLE